MPVTWKTFKAVSAQSYPWPIEWDSLGEGLVSLFKKVSQVTLKLLGQALKCPGLIELEYLSIVFQLLWTKK